MKLNLKLLILVPATLELLEAEKKSIEELASLLDVQKPFNWPPPLNDKNSQQFFMDYILKNENTPEWGMWFFILKNKSGNKNILIGNGGFKGLPNKEGDIEIGYSIIELYQNRGFASEAASGLIRWAFEDRQISSISANTLVGLEPSQKVLQKNNFLKERNTKHEGIVSYRLTRKQYLSCQS